MEHVSIGLILARVAQMGFLALIPLFGLSMSDHGSVPLRLFVAVIGSVVVSALAQTIYTLVMSYRVIPFYWTPFWEHMRLHIKQNGKYGAAFFLSSFHLLIVGLMMSVMYPTIKGFIYVGVW
jgi:hypothetical protein